MRTLISAVGFCCLIQPLLAAADVKGTCDRTIEADFQPGRNLRLELRSGDIEVIGMDAPKVRVSCDLKRPDEARNVSIAFSGAGSFGDLRIRGGPNNDIHFRIEVPKNSHLFVRSPAGDLTVSGVVGDKDIEIHAGDPTISVGNAGDYRHVDASVWAGDLNAPAFGVNKDGLFRSFISDNPAGKYRLHAHLAAGDLTLK